MSIERIVSVETKYFPGDIPTLWLRIKAIVEDMVLVYHQTTYEPEEWGQALCVMEINLEDYEEDLLLNEKEIIELIELSSKEWKICEEGM